MQQLNFVVVFLEGLLSFLSPCVLPILPVYLAVLSGSANEGDLGQTAKHQRGRLIKNTILFVLGISTAFFVLGASINFIKPFLASNNKVFLIVGGILIIIMGLFYMGILNISVLQRETKFHYQMKQMNPLTAYILGFTFSFGWTPCIGPMLAAVLVTASTSKTAVTGYLLIGIYTLGFIIPFIILALFSEKMLRLLDRVKGQRINLQKIGGMLLILTGAIMTFNGIKEVNRLQSSTQVKQEAASSQETKTEVSNTEETKLEETKEDIQVDIQEDREPIPAPDFILTDQYGNTHKLSDYKGKTVFLNFWATWCPPCKGEMPDIQKIYEKYGMNKEEVIVLGVASPLLGREGSKEDIIKFLETNAYTFPVVFDEKQEMVYNYSISAYPTTFIITPKGNVELYAPGAVSEEDMDKMIEQGQNSTN